MAALPLIVFDVNETLLDLTTLEPTFAYLPRQRRPAPLVRQLHFVLLSSDGSRMLCAFHRYRFGRNEDAG